MHCPERRADKLCSGAEVGAAAEHSGEARGEGVCKRERGQEPECARQHPDGRPQRNRSDAALELLRSWL